MTLPSDLPTPDGNANTARSRRDLLATGHDGRMITETIGRPLLRAQQTAQTYRAAAEHAQADRFGAPDRVWLRGQSALCHRRARIAADEAALATEHNRLGQAAAWAALADRYATAGRHLGRSAPVRATAITNLRDAADALEALPPEIPAQPASPLSCLALFDVDSARQALDNARREEGAMLRHMNTVEVELLLFAAYAQGKAETGYHIAKQAVGALHRARKTAPEGAAGAMDPQALADAFELSEQALDAAEAAAPPAS
ncbi:hypothetical protein K388_07316 [Streptomyces sp. KhCrAH-43]|uniref:hypothetical protein n=1 Tax=unclassified Streptomyces TaxID=2593676 RepID=UPI0003769E74|nr:MULTISPECIES: hypothetical protein [unclassified Streptomyces]MYS32944.1 hypothetical protein [Streptomyces sp. SID4920]MYX64511.1 hypothetical protein [Streptomyces sp. SID8373]RAJ45702.1 hypothetical protein K388_07316 [Streptomyces sp. KhCrAH-43]